MLGGADALVRARPPGRALALFLLACLFALGAVHGQQSQNPSPMVEHTRAHTRLKEQSPPGRRETFSLGTLFLPAGMKVANGATILFFFHGGAWLPEVAAAQNKVAVVAVQAGSGSAVYARLFDDASRWAALLKEAESKDPNRVA